ncbi:putative periplasmic serine endoprotease DegP-like precursor [Sedimentisphaera cyanobacteriorum]|uniref:Putative periplasmic serine endoprotease DegP-like n=1 Tax=Sedimentisphaera cyanobacteriorum TaxID=1940790 RepID=A0A1Q2HS84_9BACT|nr:trypsin-like peptidase domain-containing protein [Sedimentisphaera cyanobacteriorum]AQQ10093.1 putative periplasmic serine endoprotease DegP-like precursor [Sedimentisphaera cyanobacteriorum]
MKIKILLLSAVMFAAVCTAQSYERVTPVVEAYKSAKDSIVNISGFHTVARPRRGSGDIFDFFGPRFAPREYEQKKHDLGSGFVVHQDGYVVTNAHVVRGQEKVMLTFPDGKEYEARIISADEKKDIAFLKIQSEDDEQFKAIQLGESCDLMIGETVIAVGNPFGFSSSVTEGIVSAKGRNIKVREGFWLRGLIQTSAAINPGNSGGPLLNINGELIGVTTAIRAEAQNIGFAIPVDTVAGGLADMLLPENMRRVKMGLVIGRMCCLKDKNGLKVDKVFEDSPASDKGVQQGDIITEIDDKQVHGFIDFYVKMMNKDVGEKIRLTCARKDTAVQYTVELSLRPRPIPDGGKLAERFFQMGISELDRKLAKDFGFQSEYPVMIVEDLSPEGSAAKAGLKKGDIVLQIDGTPVTNMKEFSLAMEEISSGQTVEMHILRIAMFGNRQISRQYIAEVKADPSAGVSEKLAI